jgi:hypothetical protein
MQRAGNITDDMGGLARRAASATVGQGASVVGGTASLLQRASKHATAGARNMASSLRQVGPRVHTCCWPFAQRSVLCRSPDAGRPEVSTPLEQTLNPDPFSVAAARWRRQQRPRLARCPTARSRRASSRRGASCRARADVGSLEREGLHLGACAQRGRPQRPATGGCRRRRRSALHNAVPFKQGACPVA